MAIDVYSPCPGGTGKKIKFCCPDLLSDLQTVERMLEGEQYQACLSHVQTLLAKTPDRACMLAMRCLLLRMTEQWDAAQQAVEEFLRHHPDNPMARAEMAMLTAAHEGGRAAVASLQQALAASTDEMQVRVYEAMGVVAQALIVENEPLAAAPLLLLMLALAPDDEEPLELLASLNTANSVPLLIKSERRLPAMPADAPWRAQYEKALEPANRGCWSMAAERLAALIPQVGDPPQLWRALATLRAWVAETDGCSEALRKYAAMEVPLEEAVEAQTLALLLSEDPLGDLIDILSVTFTVPDIDQLQTAFSAAPEIMPARVDPMTLVEGEQPPPKGVYYLFDRAPALSEAEPTLENVPRVYCQALLFGRQTDREARLELRGVRSVKREEVIQRLRSATNNLLGEPAEQSVVGQISKSQESLSPNFRLPEGIGLEQVRQLSDQHRNAALLDRWVKSPLGLLDGKTPEEAAPLEAYRVRLLAAILLIETWYESRPEGADLNPLREKLGLPTLGPVDAHEADLRALPLIRLARVETAKLNDEQLVLGLHVATNYGVRPAMKRFAEAILDRPGLTGKEEELEACAVLVRMLSPSQEAMVYLERARNRCQAMKQSCALWDLMELSYRFARAEGDELARVMGHLQSQHLNEPGIKEAIVRFLVQIGAIRPDGTPAAMPGMPGVAPTAAVPSPAADDPGKLWTPDSQRPSEERKIWLPGME